LSKFFHIIFLLTNLLLVREVVAQKRYPVKYAEGRFEGRAGGRLPSTVKLEDDSVIKSIQLKSLQKDFIGKGYLSAELIFERDTVWAIKGPLIRFGKLDYCDSASEKLIQMAGGLRFSLGAAISPESFSELFESTIRYYENHGYPFVKLSLSSAKLSSDGIYEACIHVDRGPLVQIDSIEIKGKLKVSRNYFLTYVGIRPGRPYQEQAVIQAIRRTRALSWASESQAPRLIFVDRSARLRFFLEPQKSNLFDGFLGLLPDDKTAKVNITGQMRIRLQNTLGRGELVDVDWRRLQLNSRDLKARALFPCLLRTQFGPEYQIRLFQRDTLFVDINQEYAVSYSLSGNNAIRVFYKDRSSSLVSSKGYASVTSLPDYADLRTGSYGIGLRLEESDDRFNPRKGRFINFSVYAGNKQIRINPAINPEAYKDVKLRSAQISSEGSAEVFFPLPGRFVLLTGMKGGLFAGENILINEAFRIGGLRSLRGFDEESIYASSFLTGNLELRFLPDRTSNLFLFFNGGWYENKNVNTYTSDRPYGFGTGIQFLTKAGQFAFTYALGGQRGFPPSLRTAKIHFGITSSF